MSFIKDEPGFFPPGIFFKDSGIWLVLEEISFPQKIKDENEIQAPAP